MVVLILLILALILLLLPGPKIVYENERDQNNERTRDSLDDYLDRLAKFECDGCKDDFKRIDSNDRFSYACLQFQTDTFVEQAERHRVFSSANRDELENFLADCASQKAVARAMFMQNKEQAARHWYTSIYLRGLGLPDLPHHNEEPLTKI